MRTSSLLQFMRDTRAAATAVAAVAATVMVVGGTAFLLDSNSLVDQRDSFKSAADAAAIAATHAMNRTLDDNAAIDDAALEDKLVGVARRYILLNLEYLPPDRYERAAATLGVEVFPHRAQRTVNVSAEADLGGLLWSPAMLWGEELAGDVPTTNVRSEVKILTNPIEVVLAVDVSTSMNMTLDGRMAYGGPGSRMHIVRRAAKNLVAILNPAEHNRVAIGVVPWHFAVRLDTALQSQWRRNGWVAYPRSRRYANMYKCEPEPGCTPAAAEQDLPVDRPAWNGCVDEHRVSESGVADFLPVSKSLDLPSNNAFAESTYPATYGAAYQCMDALPGNFDSQFCYTGSSVRFPYQSRRDRNFGCRTSDRPNAMLPLTSDRLWIDHTIGNLEASGSSTHSALGVLWAQRILSHSWKDVWSGDIDPTDPDASESEGLRKAIVLLTDGDDTQCRDTGDAACDAGGGVPRTEACALAKNRGTEIFVIAAMAPGEVSERLGETLRECSSEADNPDGSYVFLNNASPEALEAAFAEIATQLTAVRRVY